MPTLRLLTFRRDDREEVGVLTKGGKILPLTSPTVEHASPARSGLLKNCRTMLDIIRAGESVLSELRTILGRTDEHGPELVDTAGVEILAPIPRPPKIVAVGLNYMDHCRETGSEPPKRPLLFAKFPSSVTGHKALIEWREGDTNQVDYEAELAVIIGRRARAVKAADAFEFIFGYTALNDVSARDLQFADGQWVRGKSLDTFCPMGPHIVTREEVPDPQGLRIVCRVNGEALQDSNTGEMIFDIPALIEYITRSITLESGDVIATGTPSGVGFSRKPPVYLKQGDEVEVYLDRIGSLINRVNVVSEEES